MTDWTGGYIAEINYTHGYYQELSPLRIAMAFASAGLQAPANGVACALGFGQGIAANLHAAASVTRWHGTDLNPAQAAFARDLAQVSGNGAQLVDQSLAEFVGRDDLPDFDYICVHGIWCRVSPENQALIVDFVRRKLKVGGVLYISYHCQPGWAPMVPVRGLLTSYTNTMTAPGAQRIDSALDFTDRLLETTPAYFAAYPRVAERLQSLRAQNNQYLVHEYFSRDWQPASFAEMAAILGVAKLTYACPARYLDHIVELNLSRSQHALLAELTDPMLAESVRDFMVNQHFRADYWVKGARALSLLEKAEAMRRQRVVLVAPPHLFALTITGRAIEGQLSAAIYVPLLQLLADYQPHTVGELEEALADQGLNLVQIFEAMLVMIGKGNLMLAQEPAAIEAATATAQRLNLALFEHARSREDIAFVASPVLGAGVSAPRIVQLFLLAHVEGVRGVAALTDFVWETLSLQDHRVAKDGVRLDAPADSIAEITVQAERFETDFLAIYLALRVIA